MHAFSSSAAAQAQIDTNGLNVIVQTFREMKKLVGISEYFCFKHIAVSPDCCCKSTGYDKEYTVRAWQQGLGQRRNRCISSSIIFQMFQADVVVSFKYRYQDT